MLYRTPSETTNDRVVKSDGKGRIMVSLIANDGGKRTGRMKVNVIEASCSPESSYEWGKLLQVPVSESISGILDGTR